MNINTFSSNVFFSINIHIFFLIIRYLLRNSFKISWYLKRYHILNKLVPTIRPNSVHFQHSVPTGRTTYTPFALNICSEKSWVFFLNSSIYQEKKNRYDILLLLSVSQATYNTPRSVLRCDSDFYVTRAETKPF